MQSGTSVTLWITSMSHTIVSYSISVEVLGAQSIKFAPASAWATARFLIRVSFFSAMAFLIDGIAPLIFSPIIIITVYSPLVCL